VPKSADITLVKVPVKSIDVLQLPLYVDYRWMMDLAVCSLVVYAISECYCYLLYGAWSREVNLSIIWCLIVVAFCLCVFYVSLPSCVLTGLLQTCADYFD
jgi:hypothetical protein